MQKLYDLDLNKEVIDTTRVKCIALHYIISTISQQVLPIVNTLCELCLRDALFHADHSVCYVSMACLTIFSNIYSVC